MAARSLDVLRPRCGWLVFVGLLAGCASFSDGPFRSISGPGVDMAELDYLKARKASRDDVRSEFGEPVQTANSPDGGEVWRFVDLHRRVSVSRRGFRNTVACQFAEVTSIVRFGESSVVEVDRESRLWSTTSMEDTNCSEDGAVGRVTDQPPS